MEYHSFLYIINNCDSLEAIEEFPSPYGVSFILIWKEIKELVKEMNVEFPSPYGVIFILIKY